MLIVTGSLAYDYIMDFPGSFSEHILPDQLHKINLSFIVTTFERRRGGTAGNVSYSLGLLDTQHILLSYAGKDFEQYKKEFEKLGIDTKYIKIDKKNYTATGFAMTDKNNNQIWGYFYGAAAENSTLQLKNIAKSTDFVLIGPQGAEGSLSFVKQCIKLRIPYLFDPGFILTQVSDSDLETGVSHAEYLIGNDYEINLIKRRVKNFASLMQHKTIITTRGENGAKIESGEKMYKIATVPVEKVVDPTGAGDAWRGGFLAGLERKLDLQICGQMGAVAAAYAVEKYGTQEHWFTKQEFTKRYKETYNQDLSL